MLSATHFKSCQIYQLKKILVVILHIALGVFLLGGCVSVAPQKASPQEIMEANVNLSAEYYRLGRLEPALVAAKKAVAADAESVSANLMLGLIYQALDEPRLAEEYYSNAIAFVDEDKGEFGRVHNNYAVFLCQNNRLPEAETHFLLAAKNKLYATPNRAYENAGICLLKNGKSDEAAVFFRKALVLAPNMPRALFELAKIQYNAEKYAEASAYFRRYHAITQGSVQSLSMAMIAAHKSGATEQALAIKTELKKRFPDSQEVNRVAPVGLTGNE